MNPMRSAFIAAAIVASTAPRAIPPPSDPGIDVVTWLPKLHSPPIAGIYLGTFRIHFETTTLNQVMDTIGTGHLAHQGDAADSVTWLCYMVPDGSNPLRIWFTSGELQGGRYIDGVNLRAVSGTMTPRPECPLLPRRFRPISLGHAIRIGMSDRTLLKLFGQPSHTARGWQMFDYAKQEQWDQCTLSNWIWMRSTKGRLVAINVGQDTSC